MRIKNNKLTITGRHIMIISHSIDELKVAAAYISLACSLYWLYRIFFKDDAQWLSFFMAVNDAGYVHLSNGHHYAIAVFIENSGYDMANTEDIISDISDVVFKMLSGNQTE